MVLEPLESRVLLAGVPAPAVPGIDTSTVGLYNADGTPAATIDRHRVTWVIVHGLDGSKDDPTMRAVAAAVDAVTPDDQVFLLDWSDLAKAEDNVPPDQGVQANAQAVQNAWAAADAIAAKLRAAKLPGRRVNLMGFSMGGQVEDRLAQDLRGGVNRIVAVDPAAPVVGTDSRGHDVTAATSYARHSRYALAFYGSSYLQGSLSADDTVQMTELQGTSMQQHLECFSVLNTMLRRDVGFEAMGGDQVSPLFSIPEILTGKRPRWRKNTFGPGYEAQMSCRVVPGSSPIEYEPVELTFVDRKGLVEHVPPG
jgi:pimeloyl-ACP methyl ester carboxylesterase